MKKLKVTITIWEVLSRNSVVGNKSKMVVVVLRHGHKIAMATGQKFI
jgi:hypothetical protein